jgi:hypothetical protein
VASTVEAELCPSEDGIKLNEDELKNSEATAKRLKISPLAR